MLSSTFHDEKLISIAVTDDTLVMAVSKGDNTAKIKVDGLEKLRVSDFKEGNIINSIKEFDQKTTNNKNEIKSLMMYAYDLDDATLKLNAKLLSFIQNKLTEHANGSIAILELEPSYGAYVVAIGTIISEEVL